MPTVPTLQSRVQERVIAPRGPLVTNAASQAAQQTQQNFQAINNSLDRFADVRTSIQLEEEKKANNAATTEAYTQLASFKNQQELAFSSLKGEDAVAAQNKFYEDYQKKSDEIANSLTTDDQRDVFDQSIRPKLGMDFDETMNKHIYQQKEVMADTAYKGGIEVSLQTGIQGWQSPRKVADTDLTIEKLTAQRLDEQGVPKDSDAYKAAMTGAKSPLYKGVLSQMVDAGDLRAENTLKAFKDRLTASDYLVAEKFVTEGTILNSAQKHAEELFATGLTPAEVRQKITEIQNPKVKEKTSTLYSTMLAQQQKDDSIAKKQFFESAINDLDNGKELSKTQYAFLDLSEKKLYDDRRLSNAKGEKLPEGSPDYFRLKTLAITDPNEIQKINIDEYNLPIGEKKELHALQDKAGGPDFLSSMGTFPIQYDAANDRMKKAGFNLDAKAGSADDVKNAAFRNQLSRQADLYEQTTGKKPGLTEIGQMADNLLIEGATGATKFGLGFDWSSGSLNVTQPVKKRLYEISDRENFTADPSSIPKAERVRIEAFLKANNFAVTEGNVQSAFRGQVRGFKRGY